MKLWKCCTQCARIFGKLSSGHRTGKGQFSLQSQRKAMPKNAQTTTQLHSSQSVQLSSIQSLSHFWLFVTPWTAAHQASLSITNSWSPPKPVGDIYICTVSNNEFFLGGISTSLLSFCFLSDIKYLTKS